MVVEKLQLANFRNYETAEIEFSPGVNMIYGDNGQGKTNIAEAVYLFSTAKSHRTAHEKDMIRLGFEDARIKLHFENKQRKMNAELRLFKDKAHSLFINDVPGIKNSEFIGTFLAVMFSPEDFSFIKDGPSERRKFMDIAISQLKPSYFKLLSEYNRYLKSKMKALKEPEYLRIYEELRGLEAALATIRAGELRGESQKLFGSLRIAEALLSEARTRLEKLYAENEEAKAELEATRQEFRRDILKDSLAELQHRRSFSPELAKQILMRILIIPEFIPKLIQFLL